MGVGPAAHPRDGPGGGAATVGHRNKKAVNWGETFNLGSLCLAPGLPPFKRFRLSLLGPKPPAPGSPVLQKAETCSRRREVGRGAPEGVRPRGWPPQGSVCTGRGRAGSPRWLPGSPERRRRGGAGALNLTQGEEKPGCGLGAVSCRASVNSAGIINQVSEMSLNPFSRIT